MSRAVTAASLAAGLLWATALHAAIVSDAGAGLQAWLPDNWVATQSDDVLVVSHPSGEAAVIFQAAPAESLEAASAALGEVLGRHLPNAVVTEERVDVELGPLPAFLTSGTGVYLGQDVHWTAGAFLHEGQVLYVIALVAQLKVADYRATLSQVMLSIAPSTWLREAD